MEKDIITDKNKSEEKINCKKDFIIDLHCHPGIRPYSKSIKHGRKNTIKSEKKWSIWHCNPPRGLDKTLNRCCNLTRFSQANFTELAKGNVKIISAGLYPIEHGFGSLRGRKGLWPDLLFNLISQIGYTRINEIQDNQIYYDDLVYEYEYYKALDGQPITLCGKDYQYKLLTKFADLTDYESICKHNIIWVVLSIEGSHVFYDRLKSKGNTTNILNSVKDVKKWTHRPLYISIAHHFYNELCGHDKSFPGFLSRRLDQVEGMHGGFTNLGRQIVDELLENSEDPRILIDIKHMSPRSRETYYDILRSKKDKIPIIVSHGAVNGLTSFDDRTVQLVDCRGKFNRSSINIFDNEIVEICDSGGFLGIQLDERRIGSRSELLQSKGKICKWNRLYKKSENHTRNKDYKKCILFKKNKLHNSSLLIWNQIQHIAEVLDSNKKNAWETALFGSDFDGLIDPLEGYWTAKDLKFLESELIKHAENFMNNGGRNWILASNKINPKIIIDKFLRKNAYEFLKNFYN